MMTPHEPMMPPALETDASDAGFAQDLPFDPLFDAPSDGDWHEGDATEAAEVDQAFAPMANVAATSSFERFFWLKYAALIAVAVCAGLAGIWKVQERSSGIRTAARLAKVDDERREVIELNRRLEAAIVGELNPIRLRRIAEDQLQMRVTDQNDRVEVP